MHRFTVAICCLLFTAFSMKAADTTAEPQPLLATKGKVLLSADFDGPEAAKGWSVNTGAVSFDGGVLRAAEKSADMHIGAFRYRIPLQDAMIAVTFRLEGAKVLHLGFDPAPGELKKKGHLYSVVITPAGYQIKLHRDKADDASKDQVLASADTRFEQNKSYTLLLETKGQDIAAQVMEHPPLRASHPTAGVKKPGLVFRIGGPDGGNVVIEKVQVWQAQ